MQLQSMGPGCECLRAASRSIVHLHLRHSQSRVWKAASLGSRLALQRGACAAAEFDSVPLFTDADLVSCISVLGDLQLSGRRGRDAGL